jgi:hypothetical protein
MIDHFEKQSNRQLNLFFKKAFASLCSAYTLHFTLELQIIWQGSNRSSVAYASFNTPYAIPMVHHNNVDRCKHSDRERSEGFFPFKKSCTRALKA